MIYLVYIAIIITVLYMVYGTLFYGTRNSISRLAVDWNKWLFMLYMWTQAILIIPNMFDKTPTNIQWLVFFIAAGLTIIGGAAIDNKDDLKCHYAGAVVSCLCSIIWLAIINPILLFIPLIAVCSAGYDRIQWWGEVGIMIAVYTALLI